MAEFLIFFLSLIPLRVKKTYITSNFGEYRPARYHMGIDFSTNHKPLPVLSVTNGRIIRIKCSQKGYGKAIYIKDQKDRTFVYAHLSKFRADIEDTIFNIQMRNKKYFVDLFPNYLITVKKGEIIGYTGQSGAGRPHLHFEERVWDIKTVYPKEYTDELKFKPQLLSVMLSTKKGNIIFSPLSQHVINVPFPFTMHISGWGINNAQVRSDSALLFSLAFDTLDYRTRKEAASLYRYDGGYFHSAYIRTNYAKDDSIPYVVKKYIPYYTGDSVVNLLVTIVSGSNELAEYSLQFRNKKPYHAFSFDTTYTGMKYSFNNYGFQIPLDKRNSDYEFVKLDKNDVINIKTEKFIIKTRASDWVEPKGFFYRTNGDSLFIYPQFPSIKYPVHIESVDKKLGVYRLKGKKCQWINKKSYYLGVFVLKKDMVPPFIKMHQHKKTLIFALSDTLSGINPDSISFYMNDTWYPIYYDIDEHFAKFSHPSVLDKKGKYQIKLVAYDNAGNMRIFKGHVIIR